MLELSQGVRGNIVDSVDGITDFITEDGIMSRSQDVTDIIEANKRAMNAVHRCGFKAPEVFRRVASIPRAVFDIAKAQGIDLMNDEDAMKRFLNDRDNLAWRTTGERV